MLATHERRAPRVRVPLEAPNAPCVPPKRAEHARDLFDGAADVVCDAVRPEA
ncbi:hypothetical protein GLX27_004571 [Malassezia furfur]|uniref:Uncharacterized protein n=1 Tax=Malassezia furfur TaxID=55194 RepID=A0ABY8EWI3_MALFU|nr:hypothetical protein GLX27_004571 [Malassezia furfur]